MAFLPYFRRPVFDGRLIVCLMNRPGLFMPKYFMISMVASLSMKRPSFAAVTAFVGDRRLTSADFHGKSLFCPCTQNSRAASSTVASKLPRGNFHTADS